MPVPDSDAMLQAALSYLALGWNVLPVGPDKRPTVRSWTDRQTRRVSESEVCAWWGSHPKDNVAILAGRISGLIVLDVDTGHAAGVDGARTLSERRLLLPPTPTVRTASGGFHYYFRHPLDRVYRNFAGRLPGVDARADGGYVVAPPSIRADGATWSWVPGLTPADVQPAPCPDWLLALFTPPEPAPAAVRGADPLAEDLSTPAVPGTRHATAFRIGGRLSAHGLSESAIAAILLLWRAARCRGEDAPDDADMRRIARDVVRYRLRDLPQPDEVNAKRLLEAVRSQAALAKDAAWLLDQRESERNRRIAVLVDFAQWGATPSILLGAALLSARARGASDPYGEAAADYAAAVAIHARSTSHRDDEDPPDQEGSGRS